VIVPTVTPSRAVRLLGSLGRVAGAFETILVDNGTGSAELDGATAALNGSEVMRMDSNLGYSRAVNLAAARAQGDVLVLLNDDSTVDSGFVEAILGVLDPAAGVVMAAGVMRDAASPALIETAGIEIDGTLLAFDYLNGEPIEVVDGGVPDPIGPSGAAAALWREAFTEAGGFDEALFAYGEDVDLALRLRMAGGSCRLAKDARGLHEHSATLGSGSSRKDYLMGYARGYLLRKWDVLRPRRAPAVLARELTWVAGQAVVDRNLGGLRGRVNGFRDAAPAEPYPPTEVLPDAPSLATSLRRRWRRRARLRRTRN
jgi:N-acetylglucosaminyl-diphospho-decaprenol L-rhamnosyltransferase